MITFQKLAILAIFRKKGLSEVMARAVTSLYDGAKTRVRVGSAYSEEFEVKIGVHQFAIVTQMHKVQEGMWLTNYCMQMILFS